MYIKKTLYLKTCVIKGGIYHIQRAEVKLRSNYEPYCGITRELSAFR